MSEQVSAEEAFYTVWMNGVVQERERIIKLLVEQLDRLVSDSFEWNGIAGDEYREFDPDRFKGRLLALIEREEA